MKKGVECYSGILEFVARLDNDPDFTRVECVSFPSKSDKLWIARQEKEVRIL